MDKKLFFQTDLKKSTLWNMGKFADMEKFGHIGKIQFFQSDYLTIVWHLGKKLFFQSDLKKSTFSLNFDIFKDMGKRRFFQSDFLRYVDIYVDMGYSELGRHSKILTCCVGTWKCKGWETLVIHSS